MHINRKLLVQHFFNRNGQIPRAESHSAVWLPTNTQMQTIVKSIYFCPIVNKFFMFGEIDKIDCLGSSAKELCTIEVHSKNANPTRCFLNDSLIYRHWGGMRKTSHIMYTHVFRPQDKKDNCNVLQQRIMVLVSFSLSFLWPAWDTTLLSNLSIHFGCRYLLILDYSIPPSSKEVMVQLTLSTSTFSPGTNASRL